MSEDMVRKGDITPEWVRENLPDVEREIREGARGARDDAEEIGDGAVPATETAPGR